MPNLTPSASPVFHDTLTALTESSSAHPDTWNPNYQALLENDFVLRAAIDAMAGTLGQFDSRLGGVEATSSVAIDRAMRLNWLYGSARMSLELFTDAWSLRDLKPIAVTSAVGGDDSIDVADTAGLMVGQEYVLYAGTTQEIVKISQVLTANRVRVAAPLTNTYGQGAKLGRSNWQIEVGQATATDASVYFSKAINLGSALSNNLLVIRRTASAALVRLYFMDANNMSWKECQQTQQLATGVTDAGMADYLYTVPASGDFYLKLVVTGGAISLKHIAAVTGKATTLAGYGIGDAYTKAEVDSAISAVPKTRVVTQPTITGPTTATPGTNITLTANSTSRLAGGTIASFDFTLPNNSKQNVAASSGAASLTLVLQGAIGETRNVLVEAIDGDGNRSAVKTHAVTLTSNSAPSMAGFNHNVASTVTQSSTASIKFSGATDPDGDPITYSIDAGSSGLTFSKASGIAANENVTMTVPATTVQSKAVSFTVYAVDNKGAQTAATISTTIVGQTVWEFTTAGAATFTPPQAGQYELIVTGAGSGANAGCTGAFNGNPGTAGETKTLTVNLTVKQYNLTLGAGGLGGQAEHQAGQAGTASSFDTLLSAAGGTPVAGVSTIKVDGVTLANGPASAAPGSKGGTGGANNPTTPSGAGNYTPWDAPSDATRGGAGGGGGASPSSWGKGGPGGNGYIRVKFLGA